MFPDDSESTKVVCSRSASEKIILAFFRKSDYIAAVPLEDCRTVNVLWYTDIYLLEVIAGLREERKKSKTSQHSSSSSQTASQTVEYLKLANLN